MRFVTINSIIMLAEKSLSWSSTTQWSYFSATTQLLWLLDTQAKSKRKSSRISMNKISTASTLSNLSLSTQLDIYSPGPLNLQCYTQAV